MIAINVFKLKYFPVVIFSETEYNINLEILDEKPKSIKKR